MVPAAAFVGAPRFHSGGVAGLARDEIPAILQRGEAVFTREQLRALGGGRNVRVSIDNRGTPQNVTDTQVHFDADGMVVRIVTDDIRRGGPMSSAIGQAFGLQRGAT